MKIKFLILLLFVFFNAQGSFAMQKINAGITVEYVKDVNEFIIYRVPVETANVPKVEYSDVGYLVKYKPVNMLATSELVLSRPSGKKALIVNQAYNVPTVYNISFKNGGKINYQNSSPALEELVNKNSNKPEQIYAYAIKLSNEKKYTEALAQADKALKINPGYALGHFLKGDIFRIMGYYKDAAREYYATLKINPYCTDAYFNIAKMLEQCGKTDLALSYYKMAYAVSPDDLEIRNLILKLGRKGV